MQDAIMLINRIPRKIFLKMAWFDITTSLLSPDSAYVTEAMKKLLPDVQCIYQNRPRQCSYQELYNIVENISTARNANTLFLKLSEEISSYLQSELITLSSLQGEPFLEALQKLWSHYCDKSKLIKNLFLSLETYFDRNGYCKVNISTKCLNMFKETIIDNAMVNQKISYMYEMINYHRENGLDIKIPVLKHLVEMFGTLNLYYSSFKPTLIKSSKEFYTNKRTDLINDKTLTYYDFIEKCLKLENLNDIYPHSKQDIIELINKIMVEDVLDELITILDHELFFFQNNYCNFVMVYNIITKGAPEGSKKLCMLFSKFLLETGSMIMNENESDLISSLLKFRTRIDEIIKVCFKINGDHIFVKAVRDSFIKFINQHKTKPARLLAKFIDFKMRSRYLPEDLLDQVVLIFRYLETKDVFEAYYKRYLSKRLILGKSASTDAEKYVVGKLRMECGSGFTYKLEGMFHDIDTSSTLNTGFKPKIAAKHFNCEFTTYILTPAFWPKFGKYSCVLPTVLEQCQSLFNEFYVKHYPGRTLQWLLVLSSCLVKYRVSSSDIKELQVSYFQAIILLLFNDVDKLTYEEIKEQLNLDKIELNRTLRSLVFDRFKILNKSSGDNSFEPDDVYEINKELETKVIRIKMNQLQYRDTFEERNYTKDEVQLDRNQLIDAALVRIMKRHNSLKHNDLMSEIFKELKFPVKTVDVKGRMEMLIGKDFIRRIPDEPDVYVYVA